jgi:glycopeptide antibiotics resistance protein
MEMLISLPVLLGTIVIGAVSYVRHGWQTPAGTRLPYPILDGLIAVSVLGILVVTLWPSSGRGGTRVHLLPLSDFWEQDPYRGSFVPAAIAAIANVFLFIPVGFLVGIRWPLLDRWSVVLALAATLSLAIEVVQFSLGGHDSSFDDVFLNTLGAVSGHGLMRVQSHRNRQRRAAGS